MPNVLESYLVSLGFSVNATELSKFNRALDDAGKAVERHTSGITKDLLKWQLGIVSAFTAMSGAVVGFADHVAEQDQRFRLLGLRMFMTQESAKKLKIGLDALGASLEEVAWDPELHGRFMVLVDDQNRLQEALGADFAEQMRGIRDLRFEFTRIKVALQYLGMKVVSDLFKALGTNIGDVVDKLRHFSNWLQSGGLQQISQWLVNNLVPILKQTWVMLKAIGEGVQEFGVLFTNVIGLLSGDDAIQGTEFSFEKLAGAIQHVVHWMAEFVQWMVVAEKMLIHLANAAVLGLSGHMEDASKELKAAIGDFTKETGAIVGVGPGAALGGAYGATVGAALGTLLFPGVGTVVGGAIGGAVGSTSGGVLGGAAGYGLGALKEKMYGSDRGSGDLRFAAESAGIGPGAGGNPNDIAQRAYALAIQAGAETGINPKLIFEQWAHETGNFSNRGARELNNLAGIRNPGSTMYQNFASLDEFASYYSNLLKGGRYAREGVLNAQTAEDFSAALKRGGYYEDSQANYLRGMQSFEPEFKRLQDSIGNSYADVPASQYLPNGYGPSMQPTDQSVNIDNVNIHIMQPNATPDQIQTATQKGISGALRRQTQRDLMQLSPVY